MNDSEDLPPTKRNKIDNLSVPMIPDDDDDNLTYEQIREKNIRENEELYNLLGINEAVQDLADCLKTSEKIVKDIKKKPLPKNVLTPTRRSMRLANLPVFEVPLTILNNSTQLGSLRVNMNDDMMRNDSESSTHEESIPMSADGDSEFLDQLTKFGNNETKISNKDFNISDFNEFTKKLKNLSMKEPLHKVVHRRIYSLAVHPSESFLAIVAGDQNGNIGFYYKDDSSFNLQPFQVHRAPINCISFCTWDPLKLFSTSHDGSIRCGDLDKRTFDIIYSSDTHITWHTEYERNLLVGNGSGCVDLIDPRTPNQISNTAQCHKKSVRTVQCHPLENHHFLTSSGLGEVSLWDVRNMTTETINPVLQFQHPKSLTSAFFSASGTKIVSTCNDDKIRIFNTSKLNTDATKPTDIIDHDNHTGRWLSVFKAKWIPGRDDTFFVGSMMVPKRLQIYRSDGRLLHNLMSESMATYCPVIEVHPTQNIFVGGNSSGRLHIFKNY